MNIFFSAGLATLAWASHDSRPTAADLVTKTYDLAMIAPEPHTSNFFEPLAPYLLPSDFESNPMLETNPSTDALAEVVLRLFDTEFSYDGRSISLSDGRLRVVAPPALHKEIERVIAFLENTFRRSVELRIDLIQRPPDAPPLAALISPKEADDLIAAAGNAARSHVLRAAPGRVAVLDATREVPIVGDYDVEIAERSVQFDPVVYQLAIGLRIAARAAIVPGGVALALVLRDGAQIGELRENRMELGGIMVVDSGRTITSEAVALQSLSVLQRSLALNLTVPEGRVVVSESKLALQTGSSRVAILVRAVAERREPFATLGIGEDRARLEVLDASYVRPPTIELGGSLFVRGAFPRSLSNHFAVWGPNFSGEPAASASPVLGDLDWIETQLENRETHEIITHAPWVIAYASKQRDQLAPALFGPDSAVLAQARPRESAALSLTLRRADAGGGVLAQTLLPITYGESSAAALGGESLFVSDADVEVATGAAALDPIVHDGFDGLVVSARPLRAGDGSSVIELCVRAHVLTGEPRVVTVGAPLSLKCERREFDELIADERLTFTAQGGVRRAVLAGGALALEVELR